MAIEHNACPDCGHDLVTFRTERQQTRHRLVELQWSICLRCRHVALKNWSVLAELTTAGSGPDRKRADIQRHDQ